MEKNAILYYRSRETEDIADRNVLAVIMLHGKTEHFERMDRL